MHNVSISRFERLPRAVVAIGTDYPDGFLLAAHAHRRAQLLYGATGVMHVVAQSGNWIVPPQRAVWIPPGVVHRVRMLGVSTRSVYIEPGVAPALGGQCQVLNVTPLLRQLLMAAVDVPAEYDEAGRDGALMALLLHEVACADSLSLHIPLPAGERLARLCQAFIEQPDVRESPEQWAALLHMSVRTFGRHFREDTGMHFSAWRQRACVVLALSRLAAGASVTEVALDFGYSSPGAFSTMFRKVLGQPPREFLADAGRPAR